MSLDYGMKIIVPTVMTDAILSSSSVPETDYPEWNASTAYAVGAFCIRASTHRIYKRAVAGTTSTPPETDITNWVDYAPTNRWAMFDNVVGTQTVAASSLSVVLRPSYIAGLTLMELEGANLQVTLKNAPSGTTIYSKNLKLDGTIITSFFDWFFVPYSQLTSVILTDLPIQYLNPELTISITGTGNVKCGVCKFGEVLLVGSSEYGAKAGIIDYSVKTKDTFGNYSVTQRAYSKRATFSVMTDKADFPRIHKGLSSIRSTPAIFIGTEEYGYDPLTIYGFYKDFTIDVAYPTTHLLSIEVEGLI